MFLASAADAPHRCAGNKKASLWAGLRYGMQNTSAPAFGVLDGGYFFGGAIASFTALAT